MEGIPAWASTVAREGEDALRGWLRTDFLPDPRKHDSTVAPSLNPPESSRSYSSVWAKDKPGTGHARSMLDSPQAWSAGRNVRGEWLQIRELYFRDFCMHIVIFIFLFLFYFCVF